MKKIILYLVIFLSLNITLTAQMWNGVDTLYGNEWIDFDRTHYKIMVAEDGIYKIEVVVVGLWPRDYPIRCAWRTTP